MRVRVLRYGEAPSPSIETIAKPETRAERIAELVIVSVIASVLTQAVLRYFSK